MKEWKAPEIECLEIPDTAWEVLDGTEPDLMYDHCEPLYHES